MNKLIGFISIVWLIGSVSMASAQTATPEPMVEGGAALTVFVTLTTGVDGTTDTLLLRLRRSDGVVSEHVLGSGAFANTVVAYTIETEGRLCDAVGFELTTDGSDSWGVEAVSIGLQTTVVYEDSAAEMFAPVTADSYPVNGTWTRTAAYLQLCNPTALVPTPTPRPTLTPSPTPSPTPLICSGALPPRLVVNGFAVVNSDAASNLREQPARDARRIGQLPGRATVRVIGGPGCDPAGGITWWLVEHDGRIGWAAEGLDEDYYLDPAP